MFILVTFHRYLIQGGLLTRLLKNFVWVKTHCLLIGKSLKQSIYSCLWTYLECIFILVMFNKYPKQINWSQCCCIFVTRVVTNKTLNCKETMSSLFMYHYGMLILSACTLKGVFKQVNIYELSIYISMECSPYCWQIWVCVAYKEIICSKLTSSFVLLSLVSAVNSMLHIDI